MADLRITLLGGLTVVEDGAELPIPGHRQERLLARLALSKGHRVALGSLAAAVWGDGDPPEDPGPSLRTYMGRLRTALDGCADVVQTVEGGYRLAKTVSTDTEDLDQALNEGRRLRAAGQFPEALGSLEAGLSLWAGPLLPAWEAEPWVFGEASRIEEIWLALNLEWADASLALDRASRAVERLSPLTIRYPHNGDLASKLAVALHSSGRSGEALDVLAAHRRSLMTDLGLDGSPELALLESQILAHDPALRDEDHVQIRSYEVGERIGEGAFSLVYKARQPSVDREVAIKIIRAELANKPEFIRRFESEARVIASLEHPGIVPLYDFWREPGAAYLVMRWLRGGTLAGLLERGPMDPEDVGAMVGQVGEALTFAHANGVIHRDVKPENIYLDEAGRFYLGDFGIAALLDDDSQVGSAPSIGSPVYASPEQLSGQPVSSASDVYALAVTAYEALTGSAPFLGTSTDEIARRKLGEPLPQLAVSVPSLSPGVDAVLAEATETSAVTRTQSVEEFVAAFRRSVEGQAASSRSGIDLFSGTIRAALCPYVGLAAFDEGDADNFHGREQLIDELLARTAAVRMVTVVGPSGSGKSSLVRAGLVPRLRRGALPGSEKWFIVTMTPGSEPFEELAVVLAKVSVGPPSDLAVQLAGGEHPIADVVDQLLPDEGELLLVLDQFEELFTLCASEHRRRTFLRALARAVSDPTARLRVVATCRADFFGLPLRYPELAALLREGTLPITPMSPDELELAIVEPAARLDVGFETGLVSALVADVNDQPGALPLLQYVLTRLWETQDASGMRLAEYQRLGGVSGGLAAEAEALYRSLPDAEQEATRRVFRRLVNPAPDHSDTKRRADRSELESIPGGPEVVAAFGDAHLLTFDHHPETRQPTVEIAHEALLRGWPRLNRWVDEDRDGIIVHRHLTTASTNWSERDHDPAELYRGGRLEAALDYAEGSQLTALEREFLQNSVDARDADVERERRRVARLRGLLAGVAVVAVIAVVAGTLAYIQQRRADSEAADAEAARLVASEEAARAASETDRAEAALVEAAQQVILRSSEALVTEDPTASLLLAVEAFRRDGGLASQGAVLNSLVEQRGVVRRVELPPVERTSCAVASSSGDGSESDGGNALADRTQSLQGYDWPTQDGAAVFTQGDGVFTVDPLTGETAMVAERPGPCSRALLSWKDGPVMFQDGDGLFVMARDSGGLAYLGEGNISSSLATSSGPDPVVGVVPDHVTGGGIFLYTEEGEPIATPVESELAFRDLWFARSGERFLGFEAGGDSLAPRQVQLFRGRTGEALWSTTLASAPRITAFAPSEHLIALPTYGGEVYVLSAEDGSQLGTFRTADGRADSVAFVDDDTLAVMSGSVVEVRDIETLDVITTFVVPDGEDVRSLRDGTIAVHSGRYDLVTVLDPNGTNPATALIPIGPGDRATVGRSAIVSVVNASDHTTKLIDLDTGESKDIDVSVPDAGPTVAVGPTDQLDEYYVITLDGQMGEFTGDELTETLSLSGPGDWFIHTGDRQGGLLATHWHGATGGVASLALPASMELLVGPIPTSGCTCGVYASPDGQYLMIDGGGELRFYDASGAVVMSVPVVPSSHYEYAADEATNRLFRGTDVGALDIVDMDVGEVSRLHDFGSSIEALALTADDRLVISTEAGTVWLLDVTSGERIGRLWEGGSGFSVTPTVTDDNQVILATQTEIVRLDLDPDVWVAEACDLAGRNFTADEWDELMPGDEAYRQTCPQWPSLS